MQRSSCINIFRATGMKFPPTSTHPTRSISCTIISTPRLSSRHVPPSHFKPKPMRLFCTTKPHYAAKKKRPKARSQPKTSPQTTSSSPRLTNPFRPPPSPSTPSPPFPFLWALTGIAFFSSLTYVFVLFTRSPPTSSPSDRSIPPDVSDRYHLTAPTFDSDVAFFESASGLNWLRWWLVRKAEGQVLEVSAGTGRNLAFFDWRRVTGLTMLDRAEEMVGVARAKARDMGEGGKLPQYRPDGEGGRRERVRFLVQSALDALPEEDEREAGCFDTVLQTMGLCSTGDPVALLKRMCELARPDGGKVLLLEHGRGSYEWLNRQLDAWAPRHADRHGCWWNRDIEAIVDRVVEESEGELVVVGRGRWHLGTTWWVELRRVGREEGKGKGKKRREEKK